MTNPVILASTSVYKKMLLERLKIGFTCISPNTDEQPLLHETPKALAIRLAREKAVAVATNTPETLVIGSDQTGELKGRVLGKPYTFDKAVEQISNQSGQIVYFHSAICVLKKQKNVGKSVHASKDFPFLTDARLRPIEEFLAMIEDLIHFQIHHIQQ